MGGTLGGLRRGAADAPYLIQTEPDPGDRPLAERFQAFFDLPEKAAHAHILLTP